MDLPEVFNTCFCPSLTYRNYIKEPDNYPDADCEISSLYVSSLLKRKGIGTKLMKYVIHKLKNEGKTQMILGCLKENYPSRAFYEKMGGKYLKTENIKFGNKEYVNAMSIIDTCIKQNVNIGNALKDIFKGKKKIFAF